MQYYTNNNNTGLKMGGGTSINKNSSMNYFGNGSFKTTTSPIQGNRLNQSSGIGGGMVQGAVTGISEGTSANSGSSSSGGQQYIKVHGGGMKTVPGSGGFLKEREPSWYIDDEGNTHITEYEGGFWHSYVRPATDEEKEIDGWYPDDDEDFGDYEDSEDDGVLPNPGKPGKGAEAPKGDDNSEDDETLPNPGKSGKGAEEPKDDEDAVTVSNRKTSSRSSGQSVGHNIVLKHEELEARRNDLSSAANEIGKLWNDIKGKEMVKVSSVWNGADGQAYVNKINAFDPKLKASIEALQLLSNAYEKADNQLQQTQSEVTKDINLL